eukprot:scaffold3271_cov181-Amphora_coffeaeformis.AAC.9
MGMEKETGNRQPHPCCCRRRHLPGDVFERLADMTTYTEKKARDLAVQLIKAMEVMHDRKIAHRDLKPENLLLRSKTDDASILLADFGFARHVPEDGLKTRCGTPAFVAPEVLVPDCQYNEMADMWSVGCLLYMLLGGYPPFQDRNHQGLFRKIRGADFTFHEMYWKNVSVAAKQLIASLLNTDPQYRMTAKQALKSSGWLKLSDHMLDNDLSASLGEMKNFNARAHLKSAAQAVLWSVRSKFKAADAIAFKKQMNEWNKDDEAKQRVDNALLSDNSPTLAFGDVYEMVERIHTSNGAAIWSCKHKARGESYAVKIVEKKGAVTAGNKSVSEAVFHELAVLKSAKHPKIMAVIDFFEEDDAFYLVMELMEGGDVFDRILSLQRYTEKDARDLVRFLLETVLHIHSKGIAHRDLKPQNLLLKSKENNADIKVADFGFACRVHTPQSLTTRCGTPTYVAPEILKNIPYDQSGDMWSVGVIIYVLLVGYPPFADNNQSVLFQKIRVGDYTFHPEEWKGISEDAKDLIKHLLVVDPLQRWTARQALESNWLKKEDKDLNKELTASLEAIKRSKRKFKNVAKTIIMMKMSSKKAAAERGEVKAQEAALTHEEFEAEAPAEVSDS